MHFRISMCTGYSCVKYKHCAQSGPRPAAAAMELEHELEIPNSQNTQHQQQHTCLVRQNFSVSTSGFSPYRGVQCSL